MKRVLKTGLLGPLLLGAACGSVTSSGIDQIGPDTHSTAVRAGQAGGGSTGVEGIASDEAGGHCRRAGRHNLVLTSGIAQTAFHATFRCLGPGDPELRRPFVRPALRRIIEQQQP
jgi:phage tail tape-measure protein